MIIKTPKKPRQELQKNSNFSALSFFYPGVKKDFWFKLTYFRLNRAAKKTLKLYFFLGEGTEHVIFKYGCSYAKPANTCKILLGDI